MAHLNFSISLEHFNPAGHLEFFSLVMLRLKLPRGNFNLAVMNNLYWSSGLSALRDRPPNPERLSGTPPK